MSSIVFQILLDKINYKVKYLIKNSTIALLILRGFMSTKIFTEGTSIDWRSMFLVGTQKKQEIEQLPHEKSTPNPAVSLDSPIISDVPLTQNMSSSRNVMAGNFAQERGEESRYIMARLNSFHIAKQMQIEQQNNMFSLLDQFGGINVSGTYFENPSQASQAEADEAIKQKSDEEVLEGSEEVLDNIKEEIEDNVEEALAPEESKDSSESTEDELPTEDSESESENTPDKEDNLPATDIKDVENNILPDVPNSLLPSTEEILESDKTFTEKAVIIEKITTAKKEQISNNTTSDVTTDDNKAVAQSSSKSDQQSMTSSTLSAPIHFIV